MFCIKLKNHKWTISSPLSLLSTSREFFFIDHNMFFPDLSYTVSQYFITLALIAVRQEVSDFESSVAVITIIINIR